MNIIEYCEDQECFFDYCLWEYKPVKPPAGKLRSVTLLYQSFETAGKQKRIYDIIEAIRNGIGYSKTVWGVKVKDGVLFWELYFYDYERIERSVSITKLTEVLKPFAKCDLVFNEGIPYFMFSIDLDESLTGSPGEFNKFNIYIGNTGCAVSSGLSYKLTLKSYEFENLYYFYNAHEEINDIKGKIACSAHMDLTKIKIDEIIWPELQECHCIVVANKRHNDGIYFSRIRIEQLLFFLKKLQYPKEIVSFIEDNRFQLDHLLYDVGFDYRMIDGRLQILKGSYYGIF
jgi:hypothetical protein